MHVIPRTFPLSLALAFFAAGMALSRDGPLKPVSRKDNPVWMDRHALLRERSKQAADVVFLGDALIQGWEGPDGAVAWKKQFEPLKAANFGAGGDRIEHVLWRITEGQELHATKPKVIVLQVGGSNLAANAADEIVDGITALVKELNRQKPEAKVLLLGLLPRGSKANDKFRDKVKEVNKGLAALEGKSVHYLDTGAKFLDKDGDLVEEAMPDGLHPSAAGYALWAEAIRAALDPMLR